MTHQALGDKVRVKPLEWSALSPPNVACHYNHTYADTPFGRYQIEWKGWKDHPSFTVELAGNHLAIYGGNTVERSRELVQADYEARILSALDLPPTVVEEQTAPTPETGIGPGGEPVAMPGEVVPVTAPAVTDDMVEAMLRTYVNSLPVELRDAAMRAPELRTVLARSLTAALEAASLPATGVNKGDGKLHYDRPDEYVEGVSGRGVRNAWSMDIELRDRDSADPYGGQDFWIVWARDDAEEVIASQTHLPTRPIACQFQPPHGMMVVSMRRRFQIHRQSHTPNT